MKIRSFDGLTLAILIILLALLISTLLITDPVNASSNTAPGDLARGAGLYDNWFALLGVVPPAGNMPIWGRQTTNTRSGPDTWRCATCHGWDYQGAEGVNKSGSNYTGFPGVMKAGQEKSAEEIIAILSGETDPAHDFSPYLDEQAMNDLALFLQKGLIDDNAMIDRVSFHVIDGDILRGDQLYQAGCASCHGREGMEITFRFEGQNAGLGDLAALDPWRFLHKSRFGTPGADMPVGYNLGWTAQEGRDTLLYAQSMPVRISLRKEEAVMQENRVGAKQLGGPANNAFAGVLTALSAMTVGLGFNVLVGAALVGLLLLIVWVLRGRK